MKAAIHITKITEFFDPGQFENEQVSVQINLLKSVSCSSFGVFGIDQNVLEATLNNANYVDFKRDGGMLKGKCTADSGETCFLERS